MGGVASCFVYHNANTVKGMIAMLSVVALIISIVALIVSVSNLIQTLKGRNNNGNK